jgi:hypothetical protein
MENLERIKYALAQVEDHEVVIMRRDAWHRLVRDTGETTQFAGAPSPYSRVMSQAAVVTVAGSGIINPSPGMDIVRYEERDAPYVYNIDHYTVFENFPEHPQYHRVLAAAGVRETEDLHSALAENVLIVGPVKLENHHWVTELPDHIKNGALC